MNIAKTIDHTLLKPEATAADIQALCREAKQYGFASVCVNTCYVKLAFELLRGSGVKVCCTVGFPLGAMAPKAKAFEAAQAVADGAEEVDMVLWIGALRQGTTAAGYRGRGKRLPPQGDCQGNFGNLPFDGCADRNGVPAVCGGGGGLCKDLHRLFHRRGNGGACGADEAGGRRPGQGKGGGRHPHL